MNKTFCTALSVVTVLCLVFLGNICFAQSSELSSSTTPPKKTEKNFDDWTLIEQEINVPIREPNGSDTLYEKITVYYISNTVRTKEGLRIVQTDIGYFDGNSDNLKLSQILPFGIDIQSEVFFEGDNKILSGKVLTCFQDGCKWIKEISLDDLNHLSKSKKLKTKLSIINSSEQQEITIPSNGFKKALAAMKKAASKSLKK